MIKINLKDGLSKYLRELPIRLFPYAKAAFQNVTFGFQQEMQKRVSGEPLRRRTGELARSFIPLVGGTRLANLFGQVETKSKYAMIHEKGGTIQAKNTKYLTIPLQDNKTATGVMRKSARQVFSEGKAFFKESKRGNLILFSNANGNLKPMFVLKQSVSIPARLGFEETAKQFFDKLLNNLKELLKFI